MRRAAPILFALGAGCVPELVFVPGIADGVSSRIVALRSSSGQVLAVAQSADRSLPALGEHDELAVLSYTQPVDALGGSGLVTPSTRREDCVRTRPSSVQLRGSSGSLELTPTIPDWVLGQLITDPFENCTCVRFRGRTEYLTLAGAPGTDLTVLAAARLGSGSLVMVLGSVRGLLLLDGADLTLLEGCESDQVFSDVVWVGGNRVVAAHQRSSDQVVEWAIETATKSCRQVRVLRNEPSGGAIEVAASPDGSEVGAVFLTRTSSETIRSFAAVSSGGAWTEIDAYEGRDGDEARLDIRWLGPGRFATFNHGEPFVTTYEAGSRPKHEEVVETPDRVREIRAVPGVGYVVGTAYGRLFEREDDSPWRAVAQGHLDTIGFIKPFGNGYLAFHDSGFVTQLRDGRQCLGEQRIDVVEEIPALVFEDESTGELLIPGATAKEEPLSLARVEILGG
ncbi:MAG: hypothetical protein HY791_08680 [Deltaproteobacteria bacterium]|nr:hypothetical protein [Deltaproteobacteria bacterium]